MNQCELLKFYCGQVDEVLRQHNITARVNGGCVLPDRVTFTVPLDGFSDLERDLARALDVDRCRLAVQVEARREDQ